MKVLFANSFEKSLKRLIWQNGWIYKTYSFVRYDIWHFFANIWRFRTVLWNHQWFDSRYSLEAFYTSLSIMEKTFSKQGYEEETSKNKKVAKMQRLLFLLKNKIDDNYIERAEQVLGKLKNTQWEFEDAGNDCKRLIDNATPEEKEHERKVFAYVRELEKEEWTEIWKIVEGQTDEEYEKYFEENKSKYTEEEIDEGKVWDDFFDGSNILGWWD